MNDEWKQTALWKELNERRERSAPVRLSLEMCMPEIEAVLKSGGTTPIDFTLHDPDHAYRVAQRMADLLGANGLPKLSDFELALLLLSALPPRYRDDARSRCR